MILRSLVFLLALTPGLASAMCSDEQHQAMSCSEGATWDNETQTCVPVVSS